MLTAQRSFMPPDVLSAANINPDTYLATDYLNHYNEVAMLIDMIAMDDECILDVLDWQPISYVEHFTRSGFRDKELAIEAYGLADGDILQSFEAACDRLNERIHDVQREIAADTVADPSAIAKEIFGEISDINGLILGQNATTTSPEESSGEISQDAIDSLFD